MKKYIGALLIVSGIAFVGTALALSNGDILAGSGIVVKQETEAGYRLNDFVLRQEVVGMAIKVNGQVLPAAYGCKGYYTDATAVRPNNWVCRAAEIAADIGLITKANTTFRPEDRVTRAEALAMLMDAGKMNTGATMTGSSFTDVNIPWQVNITAKALDQGIIDWGSTYGPNQNATRGEVFEIAKRIIQPNVAKEIEIDFQEILDLLEEL